MTKYYCLLILVLAACNLHPKKRNKMIPVDESKTIYKKGDCLVFKADDSNYIAAILFDFSADEMGTWYGFCFTDYNDTIVPSLETIKAKQICGRKVQSSFEDKGYYEGLDLTYITDSCLKANKNKISLAGALSLNAGKIKIAAQRAVHDYNLFIQSYKFNIQDRLTPPDDYRDQFKEHFRTSQYFMLEDYLLK